MQLVVVSGLSGSGKSIALHVLEDSGYYCVDNLPATLLLDVVAFLASQGHDRIAVSVDARSAALPSLPQGLATLKERGIDCRVLYLEAGSGTLLKRFSETRRAHPLAVGGRSLAEAIEEERRHLVPVAEIAHRIDTSDLRTRALQSWVKDLVGIPPNSLTILFESFGFRDGLPVDADWVFDVRMLPNPYYEENLRPMTGLDRPVIEYLERQDAVGRLVADLTGVLQRWLPEVARDIRSYVTVAIGCTGGQHRSVYVVERLAAAFREGGRNGSRDGGQILTRHRGLARDPRA